MFARKIDQKFLASSFLESEKKIETKVRINFHMPTFFLGGGTIRIAFIYNEISSRGVAVILLAETVLIRGRMLGLSVRGE